MGKTFLIASRELQAFFTTWMGYIIAAVGLVISGLLFMSFALGDEPKTAGGHRLFDHRQVIVEPYTEVGIMPAHDGVGDGLQQELQVFADLVIA